MNGSPTELPTWIKFLERGWLSSNSILLAGNQGHALIDSGYCTHAAQTVSLVERCLGSEPLDLLINTHLHSDHCGGNNALQQRFPQLQTLIPPGQMEHVRKWNPQALTYTATGQSCPQFSFDGVLIPGEQIQLGKGSWHVLAAKGHDPHSVILFEPKSRVLVSADALWESGFGVVFPELEGEDAFKHVADTLDLIESLDPMVVIPGHGPIFSNVSAAIERARQRLAAFVESPSRHAKHAAKVLIKFLLLEQRSSERTEFLGCVAEMPYMSAIHGRHFVEVTKEKWISSLLRELVASGVARDDGTWISNA